MNGLYIATRLENNVIVASASFSPLSNYRLEKNGKVLKEVIKGRKETEETLYRKSPSTVLVDTNRLLTDAAHSYTCLEQVHAIKICE